MKIIVLDQKSLSRYLWVINDDGILFTLEIPIDDLNGEKPKHTNLTSGRPAYIGGELWFEMDAQLFVSGGSGRYPPDGVGQIDDTVDVFESYQFGNLATKWRRKSGIALGLGESLYIQCVNWLRWG